MKKSISRNHVLTVCVLLTGVLLAFAVPAGIALGENRSESQLLAPSGTGFTYQGSLTDNANPASGSYDFQFGLYDAANAGLQIGTTLSLGDVPVNRGLFSVELDFGTSAFGGGGRWLQVAVRPGASAGAYTTLAPRQELTPAPQALSCRTSSPTKALILWVSVEISASRQ